MVTEDWTDSPERYSGMNAGPKILPYDYDSGGELPESTARGDLLDEAKKLVLSDRNNQYGPPSQDFQRASNILNALGYRGPGDRPMLPHDISMIITAVKLSRLVWSPEKRDNWVDIAGYAACGWECVVEENEPPF